MTPKCLVNYVLYSVRLLDYIINLGLIMLLRSSALVDRSRQGLRGGSW